MNARAVVLAFLSSGLAGCAAPPALRPLDGDHPANPDAAVAPLPPPSQTLAVSDSTSGIQLQGHDIDPVHGQDAMTTETAEKQRFSSQPTTTGVLYTCTMHREVVSDKPGKCPECGMKLVHTKPGQGSDQ